MDYHTIPPGLEEKLENVKGKLIEKLSQGELEDRQYWKATYDLLREEGIVNGPYEYMDTCEATIKIAVGLMPKLPAEEYQGLEKKYFALKGKKLSEKTQRDLDKYDRLKQNIKDYFKKEIGNKPIFRTEFKKRIEDYLMNQKDFSSSLTGRIEITYRIMGYLDREECLDIRKDPVKRGKYDLEGIENALKKLK